MCTNVQINVVQLRNKGSYTEHASSALNSIASCKAAFKPNQVAKVEIETQPKVRLW